MLAGFGILGTLLQDTLKLSYRGIPVAAGSLHARQAETSVSVPCIENQGQPLSYSPSAAFRSFQK